MRPCDLFLQVNLISLRRKCDIDTMTNKFCILRECFMRKGDGGDVLKDNISMSL
jgi:hypothetical protein